MDLWSRGGLPIDLSPWNTDQVSLMCWWSWCLVILFAFIFNLIRIKLWEIIKIKDRYNYSRYLLKVAKSTLPIEPSEKLQNDLKNVILFGKQELSLIN